MHLNANKGFLACFADLLISVSEELTCRFNVRKPRLEGEPSYVRVRMRVTCRGVLVL
jgi:hypothetical protein